MLSVTQPEDDGTLSSIVLPVYNAGPGIRETLSTLERFVRRSQQRWEIVFVCDGCTDGTDHLLRDWVHRQGPTARLIVMPQNRGKGCAVRNGLAAATGEFRIFTDVDLAYGIDEVCKIVERLRQGADLAIASRTCRDSEILLPADMLGYAFARRLQSSIFSCMVRSVLGIPFRDTQAGLKGLTKRAAELLLPLLECNGFEFDCEWLAAASRLGLQIAEVPVRVRYERGAISTTGVGSMAQMVRGLLAIRRRVRRIEPVAGAPSSARRRRAA